MSVALSARGLHKEFREGDRRVEVLKGADVDVDEGELLAVVGPSGSGKSTLLHLLGGLDRPDEGSITIGHERLEKLDLAGLAAFRNRQVGFIFQFHQLLPDFTALENVMMPGRIALDPPMEVENRALERLEEVGLGERLNHFPGELSGGERQRVAICRALALDPPLLLADEPTGNLDPEAAERVLDLFLGLHARYRMSAVIVTHNPSVAERCARVQRLEDGVLRAF